MSKILGLDFGTNSIGWAIVETEDNIDFRLKNKGVHIFQEGVKIEKGQESSKASERTAYRSARRIKFRRKLRKINTLKVLCEHDLCPQLSLEELKLWQTKKIYPKSLAFRKWWLTDEKSEKNPYYFRYLAVNKKLDLSKETDRHKIGRAFYHMAQRRGFLSNRLEGTKESEGAVKKAISELSQAMGGKTLGEHFYEKHKNKERIRQQYTHREEHYLQEFKRICEFQELGEELVQKLEKAIFYQRPLRSQKGLVGKCPLEPNKPRCPISHPEFEKFRMLSFLNNIKIKTPQDEKMRPLNENEREKVIPQFFRKSKENFDFEDIAKQLAPKKAYKFYKDKDKKEDDYIFNFHMKSNVSGCPMSAKFKDIFGESWENLKVPYTREKDGKESFIDISDAWHALFTFDSEEKLYNFAQTRLQLKDKNLKAYTNIIAKQGYGSLSLKAIKKINQFLEKGLIYSHATFLANLEEALPKQIWEQKENQNNISQAIEKIIQTQSREKQLLEITNGMVKTCKDNGQTWSQEAEASYRQDMEKRLQSYFGKNKWDEKAPQERKDALENSFAQFKKQMQENMGRGSHAKIPTKEERIKNYLTEKYGANGSLHKIYHPSAIEAYPKAKKANDGNTYLGSPMTSSVRNPMAMRSLHRLRKLINELIKTNQIDKRTKINIEMARDLKNANERKALQDWQRGREKTRKEYAAHIQEHYKANGQNTAPSEEDILRYQLWEEQGRRCIYTGKEINIEGFLGASSDFDIEHTIPRSVSGDNSMINKTLCHNQFNRNTKRNKIPYELANHDEILERIEHWKEKYEELDKKIEKQKRIAKGQSTKEGKDRAIQARHKLTYERNYWRDKYNRFTMKDVPEGFKNSQLVDTGIITKYSRLYLKTVFEHIYTVKGSIVKDFRVFWGLQKEYEKKERVNHIHHCIDAITIACISKKNYEELAKQYHEYEEWKIEGADKRPNTHKKPWDTFTEDIRKLQEEVFISHHTPDNFLKKSKKLLRKRGKIIRDNHGKPILLQGDSARASLHKETFYGAIKRTERDKKGKLEETIRYAVRKPLDSLQASDIKNIVDKTVREKIEAEIDKKGLKEALKETIWLNEEKQVPIKKVRCFAPTVKAPLVTKEYKRDYDKDPEKPHKHHYFTTNDGNYLMAIYEGQDNKGGTIRDFEIINNMDAASRLKASVQSDLNQQNIKKEEGLIPKTKQTKKGELPLKTILKTGTMVLFWKNSPEEIWELDKKEQTKRLFKLTSFEADGRIQARFHQVAKPDNELEKISEPDFNTTIEKVRLSKGSQNMLVEGTDFKIDILGNIRKL